MREYDASRFSLMTVEEEARITDAVSESLATLWSEVAEEQGFEALVGAPCSCQFPSNHDLRCGWGKSFDPPE